ncbi:hypothetical protein OYT1_ch0543 [Ferriphaselus amnicola]|uniref:Uncharacterized protein n=1 Tax=Ferriphaselus amnicola TaxID=1188319 RepID=A0A2Z6G9D6_9PROT|nr:hypothetical protein OYT1_ch0543 [Ferriphaselus amnicola]
MNVCKRRFPIVLLWIALITIVGYFEIKSVNAAAIFLPENMVSIFWMIWATYYFQLRYLGGKLFFLNPGIRDLNVVIQTISDIAALGFYIYFLLNVKV